MTDQDRGRRSPTMMCIEDTVLLVVDVQQRLVPVIDRATKVVWNCRRLIDGARLLGVDLVVTEQYPQGLGATVDELAQRLEGPRHAKASFSCTSDDAIFDVLRQNEAITKVLLCGIETHVCVMQTALDLLAGSWDVYVAVDAVGSRHRIDHKTALRRLDSSGVTLTTTEAALFEWCSTAAHPSFKEIGQLVRETAP